MSEERDCPTCVHADSGALEEPCLGCMESESRWANDESLVMVCPECEERTQFSVCAIQGATRGGRTIFLDGLACNECGWRALAWLVVDKSERCARRDGKLPHQVPEPTEEADNG